MNAALQMDYYYFEFLRRKTKNVRVNTETIQDYGSKIKK